MHTLKISIIVPVYKIKHEYLIKCLDSLSNQTADKAIYEVILVDDNNNEDECGIICDEYALKNSNFRVFHQINQGVSAARNLGITESKAPYLAFVDADDWVELNAIEIMLKAQKKYPSADLWCFIANLQYKNKTVKNSFWNKTQVFVNDEIEQLQIQMVCKQLAIFTPVFTHIGVPWAKLYTKSIIKNNDIYFDNKLKRAQDNIFNLYYMQFCNEIVYLDIPTHNYNINNDSICQHPNKNVIKQYELLHEELNKFIQIYKKDDSSFNNALNTRVLFDFNMYYRLYFKHIPYKLAKLEYKELVKNECSDVSLKQINNSGLSLKEKIYVLVLKSKSLKLLSLLNKAEEFYKKKIKKEIIN